MRSRTRQGLPGVETPYVYYRLAKIWDKQYETGIDLNETNIFSTTYGRSTQQENPPADFKPGPAPESTKKTISIKPK